MKPALNQIPQDPRLPQIPSAIKATQSGWDSLDKLPRVGVGHVAVLMGLTELLHLWVLFPSDLDKSWSLL